MNILTASLAVSAIALSVSAIGVSAAPVTITLTGVSPTLSNNVSIIETPSNNGSTLPRSVYAGVQNYDTVPGGGALGSFAAFCLDLAASVSPNGTYTYNTINEPFTNDNPFSNSFGFNSTQRDRIQALFDANYASASTDWSANAAAFQLALWESAFESDANGLGLGGGDFQGADISGSTISAKAGIYLTAASNYLTDMKPQRYALTYLESAPNNGQNTTRSQNLVTATVIPLPAAGLLLFGALGALGVASRRRKASSEA